MKTMKHLFKHIVFTLLCLLFIGKINAQNSGKNIFDNSFLHQIKFESSSLSDEDLWDTLTDEYVMVNMMVDGELVDSIAVRHKGFTSKASHQKPLKIDINKYVKEKKYDGLKKFNLHNNFKESFLIIEGEMEFFINGEVKNVKAGEAVDIPPKTLHISNCY